jgi:tetratricopeptide (TPR) repeat protein
LYDDPRFEWNRYGCAAAQAASAYVLTGRPDLWVQALREDLQRGDDPLGFGRSLLAIGTATFGKHQEAMSLANEAIRIAESTENQGALLAALQAYGASHAATDPATAAAAYRRQAGVASEIGNRLNYLLALVGLSQLEIEHDIGQALAHLAEAVRGWHNIGDVVSLRIALAYLCIALGQADQPQDAAVVAGFARSVHTLIRTGPTTLPEFSDYLNRLRPRLSPETFDALAARGANMSTAEAVRYALESIDRANERATF